MNERVSAMVFRVYAGVSGTLSQSWHVDCGRTRSPSQAMSIDIEAPPGTIVRFRIYNDGSIPITYRYRVDYTYFPRGTDSSVMVEVDSGPTNYVFRYTHLNVDSSIPSGTWSAYADVQPGQSSGRILGTVSDIYSDPASVGYGVVNGIEVCTKPGGTTDVGGLCSSDSHLHQAASDGYSDPCLAPGAAPNKGSIPTNVTGSTIVLSV